MRHVFIRHPPLPGMEGICYGALDVQITQAVVLKNADTLKKALPFLPVISSPLQRCFSLAEAISPDTKKDIRLVEMNFGDWQGREWDSIDRLVLDAWAKDVTKFRAPNGENFIDVINRVAEFLHELTEPHILITHAGVIRAGHYLSGAMPVEQAAAIEIPYATPINIRI